MVMPSSSRLIALMQLIRKWRHKLSLKREMEMLKLMWECLRVSCTLQRINWALLPDALPKRCIYLGVTSPIKFNCFLWGSPGKSELSWKKGVSHLRVCGKGLAIGKGEFHIYLFGMWTGCCKGVGKGFRGLLSDCWIQLSWKADYIICGKTKVTCDR